jgi:DNA repair exonuclease SbcCD ATPase subunit
MIHGLQAGGRMVGIITHVPESNEEFDQRLIVDKAGGSSRVQVQIS